MFSIQAFLPFQLKLKLLLITRLYVCEYLYLMIELPLAFFIKRSECNWRLDYFHSLSWTNILSLRQLLTAVELALIRNGQSKIVILYFFRILTLSIVFPLGAYTKYEESVTACLV